MRKSYTYIRLSLLSLFSLIAVATAFAVTDREMDEARAITAQCYLRYANDGSGYLDEFRASSMAELTSKLKEKERENLKAFNQVAVPKDYANWDKEKLTEFWGVTFFTSPLLSDKGKAAKSRVRSRIAAMSVAAPAPKEETPAPQPEPTTEESTPAAEPVPTAEAAAAEQQDILADQEAIEKDSEDAEGKPKNDDGGLWIYVVVLVILIGVVIWLVVIAANMMKKRPDEDVMTEADQADLRDKARKAIAAKNEELETMRKRLEQEENNNAEIGKQLELLKVENTRLQTLCEKYRTELATATAATAPKNSPAPAPKVTPKPAPTPTPVRQTPVESVAEDVTDAPKEEAPKSRVIKVLYLGRANQRGIFVRADRRYNAENTIYRLDTNDGLVGTFRVVDAPESVEMALADPVQNLLGGSAGDDLEDTDGVENIFTESAGTAIFENGYWRVLRKTRIRYE